mmetsp:Transcript_125095/g.399923  ORF Transcript_125095/g.399923 Transcript_125095/m.399923 type:complete len:243 (+) Transcript_125095:706-1434(+)
MPHAGHRGKKPRPREHRGSEHALVRRRGVEHGLGDHGAALLVRAQLQDVLLQEQHQSVPVSGLSVLHDVPHHVVPVDVHAKPEGIRKQAVHQTFEMLRQTLLQEALQDPAPILVPCRLANCCRTSARDLVDDESHVVCLHRADALLNDVVGVGALNRCPNMAVHLRSESQALGLTACVVEGILHEPAAVRVSRELPDVADPRRGWWGAFPRWQLRAGRALQARRAAVQGPRADLKADRSKHL